MSWTALKKKLSSQDEETGGGRICGDFASIHFGLCVELCVRVCPCTCVYVRSFVLKGLSYQSFSDSLQPVLKHASCLNRPSSLALSVSQTMQHALSHTHTHTIK